MSIAICTWKHGKRWAYSVTYDEALADLSRFVMPLHEEFGIRGHVEVVAGQIGEARHVEGSSYNGLRHMNAQELRDLIARGWGVGNHSWSHGSVADDLDLELRQAKERIEEAIGRPVVLYCSPGNNRNMSPAILDACRRYEYLAAMSITDAVNRPEEELFALNRCPVHHEWPPPFSSAFDPWHRLRQARETGGWIIDYLHCPLEEPVHPAKDVSWRELRQRFEAVDGEGDEVWLAMPEEALDYHITRRHSRLIVLRDDELGLAARVACDEMPKAVQRRELTLELTAPAFRTGTRLLANGVPMPFQRLSDGRLRCDVEVRQPVEIRLEAAGGV